MSRLLETEYITQGKNKHTKKRIIFEIIRDYEHNYHAEGYAISKRRLWYILKPTFSKATMPVFIQNGEYSRRDPISNQDYNKYYNELANEGIIDDTYIADSSREMGVNTLLPHIILAPEKATIKDTVIRLANSLGCSYYVSSGQSSIYGAKKLIEMVGESGITSEEITVLTLTDHDKSGHSISENIGKHFNIREYRTLLTPDQVPADRVDEYFDIFPDGTKAYELDVLNIHELKDIFLSSVPEVIANEITDAHSLQKHKDVKENEVIDRVYEDDRIKEIDDEIEVLEKKRSELSDTLENYYSELYDEKNPTVVYDFDLHDITQGNINHKTLNDWWVA